MINKYNNLPCACGVLVVSTDITEGDIKAKIANIVKIVLPIW